MGTPAVVFTLAPYSPHKPSLSKTFLTHLSTNEGLSLAPRTAPVTPVPPAITYPAASTQSSTAKAPPVPG
ncbi:MAG: hypothetical protein QW788_04655, partial [Candidatus Hadarchaeales archaeon]